MLGRLILVNTQAHIMADIPCPCILDGVAADSLTSTTKDAQFLIMNSIVLGGQAQTDTHGGQEPYSYTSIGELIAGLERFSRSFSS